MASNKKLSATIIIGGAISGSLKSTFGSIDSALGKLGRTVTDLTKRQKTLNTTIGEMTRIGSNVNALRREYARLTEQIERASRAQSRLRSAKNFKESSEKIGKALDGAAVRTGAAGLAMGGVVYAGIRKAIERENVVNVIQNSGVSREDAASMVMAAQRSKQFGVSVTKATETVSELRTALGDTHHAIEALPIALKAISGLQMYDRLHHTDMASGDSAYQLAKVSEERGGASDPEAMRRKYNWAFKALTGSNGKVSVSDMLTAVRSGKGAVQAMSDEAFFGDTFLQQSMGADRYGTSSSTLVNAWIGGHQTHSAFDHMLQMGLLSRSGVTFDKNGRVKTVSPSALVDAQTFLKDPQKWVDTHLIPLAKKRGVDLSDPAQIMAFVGAIASNPNAANMLLSRMRFDANIWKDRRNVLQANDAEASDQANRNSSAGKMDNARARLEDAETRMGAVLLPVFANAMGKAASALEAVNKFAEENPRLFKAVATGFAATAGALIVVTPLLLAASGVLSTIATIRLARAASEVAAVTKGLEGVAPAAASAGGGVLGFIGKLGVAVSMVGVALAAAKALGLPDTDAKKGAADIRSGKWLAASADLPAGSFIRALAARATGKSNEEIAASLSGGGNPALPNTPLASARGAAPTIHSNDTYNFNLTQQPGQDADEFAKAVMKRIQNQQGIKQRSIMFDGATQ
jgi:hypothetical protein